MAGNLPIPAMPTVPSPDGGYLYLVKDGEDYKVPVGGANGLLQLGADGTISPSLVSVSWASIQDKPATFTPAAHTHGAGDITSGVFNPSRLGSGTPSSATFLRGDGTWTTTPSTTTVTWGNISGVPVYATRWPTWTEVTSKPDVLVDGGNGTLGRTYMYSSGSNGHIRFQNSVNNYGYLAVNSSGTLLWNGDSIHTSGTFNPASKQDVLGFTPVRQAGGSGMSSSNTVLIGWGGGATGLLAQVDATPLGNIVTESSRYEHITKITALENGTVKTTGTQTIGGAKTFSTAPTAPDFISTSDARLKSNIEYKRARTRLADLLRFVTYFQEEAQTDGRGLIAQDVLEVAPEYVHVREDGYLAVDKTGIALECVIGLSERIRDLEEQVSALTK